MTSGMKNNRAFTLIEMLVVIGIIAIVATLVVGLNGLAQAKKRDTTVEAEKQKLMLNIGNYQAKLNYYPPDNGGLVSNGLVTAATAAYYDALAQSNPLPYELAGAYLNSNSYVVSFDSNQIPSGIPQTTFNNVFGRTSVANSNPDEPHSFYIPKSSEYTNFPGTGISPVNGLSVPVLMVDANGNPIPNFWHYDASSPNRHNTSSYDLWAVYVVGTKNGQPVVRTNGNW
jgi:prepilin-type N-terminal cleavage/methylation domain-containing protein